MESGKKIVKHGPKVNFDIFEGSVAEYLIPKMKALPQDYIIQVNGLTGERHTVGQLLGQSLQVAEGLGAKGVQQGQVVAVVGCHSHAVFTATLGVILHGATAFPIDPSMKTVEFQDVFGYSNPTVVFCDNTTRRNVSAALDNLKNNAAIYMLETPEEDVGPRFRRFEDILNDVDVEKYQPQAVKNPREQVAVIMGSSGTTGLPKGVMISHRSLCYQMQLWGLNPYMRQKLSYLQVTQLHWLSGLFSLLSSCAIGFKRVYVVGTDPLALLGTIHRHKPGWVFLAPASLGSILRHPDFHSHDLSSLGCVVVGGDVLPRQYYDEFKARWQWPCVLGQMFGMTEVVGVVTALDQEDPMSVGRITMGITLKVLDSKTGETLGPNQTGELCFKNEGGLMLGYFNNEAATREVLDADGYYHTGDLGYYTQEGLLYFEGRVTDIFKCMGYFISPAEIEDVILQLDGVTDVGVASVGLEGERELPCAAVVRARGSALTEASIAEHVADRLSDYKHLRGGVRFVEAIPRTTTGKIQRKQLKGLYRSLLKTEAT